MQSEIKVGFENIPTGGVLPVLNVRLNQSGLTVDKLLISFFEQLGSKSSWLQVEFIHSRGPNGKESNTDIVIRPISDDLLLETSNMMKERSTSASDLISPYMINNRLPCF